MIILPVPRSLPRIVRIAPEAGGPQRHMFLSEIIKLCAGQLFPGYTVRDAHAFRVTRNSDLYVDEEEVKNLRTALQGELSERRFGEAVRIETAHECPPEMTELLMQQYGLTELDLYQVNGPVNLVRLMQIPDQVDRPDLKYRTFTPGLPV